MIVRILLTGTTLLLLTLVASVGAAAGAEPIGISITELESVRAYAAAARVDGRSYAVDGGRLYAGVNGVWESLSVPPGVIVNAVAVDRLDPDTVFIGAANGLSVFVSRDGGEGWKEVHLDSEAIGGVTAVAFDASNRLLYVGTDADGVYRLRDIGAGVGPGLVASGHLLLAEPVQEIAVTAREQVWRLCALWRSCTELRRTVCDGWLSTICPARQRPWRLPTRRLRRSMRARPARAYK